MAGFHQAPCAERCNGSRLDEYRIPRNESRSELPRRNCTWKVPGCDYSDDAYRLAQIEQIHPIAFGRHYHSGHARAFAREIPENVNRSSYFTFRFGKSLAFFARHVCRKLLKLTVKDVSNS